MNIAKLLKGAGLALAATLSMGAAERGSGNWNTAVAEADGAYVIGNPQAKLQLTEFVSYTCPHCATFTREGEPTLQIAYIGPGRVKLERRHIIRNSVDLTAAMLTNCGDPVKFPRNHAAFMLAQPEWLPISGSATQAQRNRWNSGDQASRRRAIASDMGFYTLMTQRGYSRVDIDRCLADGVMATKLADSSQTSFEKYEISGTPSFAIDGAVLLATHNWAALAPQLSARF